VVAALALCSGVVVASGAGAAEPPDTIDPDAPCVSSDCHATRLDYSLLHYAEIANECTKCHQAEGDQHEFDLDDPPGAEQIHDPAEEDCLDCHDPHGSEAEGILSASSQLDLCFDCHDTEDVFQDEHEHGPVAKGACTKCHNPHASQYEPLLRESGSALCEQCHEDLVADIQQAEHVHDPAEEDCTDCHHPHTGPFPKMLSAEPRDLCNECHDDIVEVAEGSTVAHDPVLSEEGCLSCHSPHAGWGEFNFLAPQTELCLGCHDKPFEANDGSTTLMDMAELFDERPHWHEPIREDGCAECHDPHGGEHARLLRKPFPPAFYNPFEPETYGLCFSCHERSLVTREVTRSSTGFRDGDRNLHFLHVNKKKKGRSCRACHDLHASQNGFLIRETVPFGKWMMPLNFKDHKDGGSCQPGCHRTREYDRGKK
jgi:predicted CXXCH cytochrome family protein